MDLAPLRTTAAPHYPVRRVISPITRWLGGLAASVLLSATACSGGAPPPSPPLDDVADVAPDPAPEPKQAGQGPRNLAQCQMQARLSGMVAPTNMITCSPAGQPVHPFPAHLIAGTTCGSPAASAGFNVTNPVRARLSFNGVPTNTRLSLIAPDRSVAAELTPTRPCVLVDLEAGAWTLVAVPITASGNQAEHFAVVFERETTTP